MAAITVTVVATHDLAKGVVLGVLHYRVIGQLFFASADVFAAAFEHHGHPTRVEIDMTDARLWDPTAQNRNCANNTARSTGRPPRARTAGPAA